MHRSRLVFLVIPLVLGPLAASPPPASSDEAERVVEQAKAHAGTIPEQARALTLLAWPDGPVRDPQVSTLARKQIVDFGDHGIEALRERIVTADPRFGADIVSALLETRLVSSSGQSPHYLPALHDALWFGSMDAKRLAMGGLSRSRSPLAVLPIIDSAYEHPELIGPAIATLKALGDDRARRFLGEVLTSGHEPYAVEAADALATIGGRAIDVLRDATASSDPAVRGAAIDVLVPVSRVEDLTILYEYIAQFPDDDPKRLELVVQRATQLESLLGARQLRDAAGAGGN